MSFLERVCKELSGQGTVFAIAGGHAVALHGAVRGTIDIDFVIEWTEDNLVRVEKATRRLGLVSRLPVTPQQVYKDRDSLIKDRNLIAWNFYNPKRLDEQLDLIIDYDLSGHERIIFSVGGIDLPVLGVEALIAMKKKSGRPQDLHDIDALESIKK